MSDLKISFVETETFEFIESMCASKLLLRLSDFEGFYIFKGSLKELKNISYAEKEKFTGISSWRSFETAQYFLKNYCRKNSAVVILRHIEFKKEAIKLEIEDD